MIMVFRGVSIQNTDKAINVPTNRHMMMSIILFFMIFPHIIGILLDIFMDYH
jgi:hypothetical protein